MYRYAESDAMDMMITYLDKYILYKTKGKIVLQYLTHNIIIY